MYMHELLLSDSWSSYLRAEFDKTYMLRLAQFLADEIALDKRLYPAQDDIFAALNTTSLEQVKVVILGQDPYHGTGQAHGLSFSVQQGVAIPPSLKNIYQEMVSDLGIQPPMHGNLQSWAEQGVLLLNSVLTVEHAQAASHRNQGWEQFTDRVVELINSKGEHVVFLLWGADAQRKGRVIDQSRHCVLQAPHPSPLSAYRGFLGCQHFSQANAYLTASGKTPIDWQIEY